MDSDDYLLPDAMERCYDYAKKTDVDFIMFDANVLWEDGLERNKKIESRYNRSTKDISSTPVSGVQYWGMYSKCGGILEAPQFYYIRKSYITDNNLLFVPGIFYEDNDWTLRMFLNAKQVSYYPKQLYFRRYRKGSVINSNYTSIHMNGSIVEFCEMLKIYVDVIEPKKKQMCRDMLFSSFSRILRIMNEVNEETAQIYAVSFYEKMDEDNMLSILDENLEMCIINMLIQIENRIRERGCYDKKIADKRYYYQQRLHKYIRNSYKLEQAIHIGIYGMGKACNDIFEWYLKNGIDIRANVEFIVTDKKIKRYMGFPVRSIAQLKNTRFDHIIIASTKYAEEMIENLKDYNICTETIFTTETTILL